MTESTQFLDVFRRATGCEPYDYQRELGSRVTPPAVIEVPTGSGKTLAVLLPWLSDPDAPRRLIYALPMRALVEQTARVAADALNRLGDTTPVHVLMGGVEPADWRIDVDGRAVVVGTIDMLMSRALNRGYAESRFAWPVSFGLLNSDCRWVFDEVQLMGPARATSAQLCGLRSALGVVGRCETVWMSATIDRDALLTVDHPQLGDVVRLSDRDRTGPLRKRLEAVKRVERVDLTGTRAAKLPVAIATAVAERHRAGTRSIVVLNRVELAQQVHAALAKGGVGAERPRLVLLHSRFRPPDRAARMIEALAEPATSGTIVVATQVIEAGVDLSSALLATETAPFSSLVQRLGRCNRAGDDASAIALWLDRGPLDKAAAAPYHPEDLDASTAAFAQLVGQSASPAVLETLSVPERREETAILRRRDLLDLFDTAPDLSGTDVDVAPYIRPDDERTVSVFFRTLAGLDAVQIGMQAAPGPHELVAIPIAAVAQRRQWIFDIVEDRWRRVGSGERARPGSTLMLDAADGGYGASRGWTGRAADIVEPIGAPHVRPEAIGADPGSTAPEWVTLTRHLDDTRAEASALCAALDLSAEMSGSVIDAAAVHDIGKAHPAFQAMLIGTAPPSEREALNGSLWAKSAYFGGRHVRRHFRHELASALALSGGVIAGLEPQSELVRYLVAAHHGRVRMSIRPAPAEEPPEGAPAGARFALGVLDGDLLPCVRTPLGVTAVTALDLAEMELGGGGRSWSTIACALRDAHGPFVLGYLEALVRIADWRASG